jgi:hypothetical protein
MKPHDGLLAVALLLIAIAAGCDKSKDSQARNEQTPATRVHEPTEPPASAQADPGQTPTAEPAAEAPAERPDEPATAELTRARKELEDLAEGALSLRAALLGAEFKNVQAAQSQADSDEDGAGGSDGPEVDDDSR